MGSFAASYLHGNMFQTAFLPSPAKKSEGEENSINKFSSQAEAKTKPNYYQDSCKLKKLSGKVNTSYSSAQPSLKTVADKYGLELRHNMIRGLTEGSDGTLGSNIVNVSRNGQSIGGVVVGDLKNPKNLEEALRRQLPQALEKPCEKKSKLNLVVDRQAEKLIHNNGFRISEGGLQQYKNVNGQKGWKEVLNLRGEGSSANDKVKIIPTKYADTIKILFHEKNGNSGEAYFNLAKKQLLNPSDFRPTNSVQGK